MVWGWSGGGEVEVEVGGVPVPGVVVPFGWLSAKPAAATRAVVVRALLTTAKRRRRVRMRRPCHTMSTAPNVLGLGLMFSSSNNSFKRSSSTA
ncbi:hypothetical protein SUDANB95_01503 [Actinosynnema sp. ALI-1.44]